MVEKIPHGTVSVQEIIAYLQNDRYMGVVETARYLNLSPRTVRDELPESLRYRIGRKLLFRKSEVDRWMAGQREAGQFDLDRIASEAVGAVLGPGKIRDY